jgi:hypothetical protein
MAEKKSTKKEEKAPKAKTAKAAPAKTAKGDKGPAKKAAAPKKEKAPKAAHVPIGGPAAKLKALFGSKSDAAKKLAEPLALPEQDTEELGDRLSRATNSQLLRLARVVDAVKKYGGRDGLIQKLGTMFGKAKDKDYLAKLGTFSLPKLLDLAKSHERRARA